VHFFLTHIAASILRTTHWRCDTILVPIVVVIVVVAATIDQRALLLLLLCYQSLLEKFGSACKSVSDIVGGSLPHGCNFVLVPDLGNERWVPDMEKKYVPVYVQSKRHTAGSECVGVRVLVSGEMQRNVPVCAQSKMHPAGSECVKVCVLVSGEMQRSMYLSAYTEQEAYRG
jgi:hypothetical protein